MAFDDISSKDSPGWRIQVPCAMEGALELIVSVSIEWAQMHKSSCSENCEQFCVQTAMSRHRANAGESHPGERSSQRAQGGRYVKLPYR